MDQLLLIPPCLQGCDGRIWEALRQLLLCFGQTAQSGCERGQPPTCASPKRQRRHESRALPRLRLRLRLRH